MLREAQPILIIDGICPFTDDPNAILFPAKQTGATMPEYFGRICWNTNNWEKPSGDGAALEGKNTYLGQFGFGHEEWLFDSAVIMGGWKYGFLQSLSTLNVADTQELKATSASILLFARMEDGVSRAFVRIEEALALSEEEARAAAQFNMETLFRSRADDLQKVLRPPYLEAALARLRSEKGDPKWINLKFRPEKVTFLVPPQELQLNKNPRYQLRKWEPDQFLKASEANLGDLRPAISAPTPDIDANDLKSVLRRGVSATMMDLMHKRVQALMRTWIRNTFPDYQVSDTEEDCVDITLWKGRSKILLEIKTAPVARACIREALGQLLEYNHHGAPRLTKAHELVILGPASPTQKDIDYIRTLRAIYKLPVVYAKYDFADGMIHGWVPSSGQV